jgi:serine/threonine-protein kinase
VSAEPLDPQSAAVIAWLEAQGGWGLGRLQIDFSIERLEADASVPFQTFAPSADFYVPDCDAVPMPVPAGGALEGESGYACANGGDCHLIVWHEPSARLFEMWRADIRSGVFHGGCLAVWDLASPPPATGRGEGCTSADAAGLPIAPLLFSADEVAAGEIAHAVRFALPNARIRSRTYVRPATHATGAASGGASAPAYGARLRLRADYPLASLPSEGARVVARALQRYGMILADGGNVALMGRSDRFTSAKWAGLLGPRDLQAIRVSDFVLVDGSARFNFDGECRRALGTPGRPVLVP